MPFSFWKHISKKPENHNSWKKWNSDKWCKNRSDFQYIFKKYRIIKRNSTFNIEKDESILRDSGNETDPVKIAIK